jgi:hypothetical protein
MDGAASAPTGPRVLRIVLQTLYVPLSASSFDRFVGGSFAGGTLAVFRKPVSPLP